MRSLQKSAHVPPAGRAPLVARQDAHEPSQNGLSIGAIGQQVADHVRMLTDLANKYEEPRGEMEAEQENSPAQDEAPLQQQHKQVMAPSAKLVGAPRAGPRVARGARRLARRARAHTLRHACAPGVAR